MTNREAVIWLINVTADIGKAEHRDLWHYEQALSEIKEMLESQPEIITCGECKNFKNTGFRNYGGVCSYFGDVVQFDTFCSNAERRTDG